ncbi:hypothetical protein KQH49_08915 [Mycetohabitans sp. B5]|uniref:Uncharacterized protein n=1 Tax=Mycetohabitans endofungorum TaxID=417203 RepID=A0A2P5K724_9BURK|nr:MULTISPECIES: hypothetical protein [Mycetohabitans]MCG1055063.1 hypothetical protein [Mycetohabitans sp. B5]PPB81448.1 hypothetical protein B0O95_11921 [Mycetohabitans endofungorum]
MTSIQVTRDTVDQVRVPIFALAPYLLVLTARKIDEVKPSLWREDKLYAQLNAESRCTIAIV